MKNEKGQMAIELILIMIALFGAATFAARQIKSQGYIANIVQGPWTNLAGMIESGIWAEAKDARLLHPNHTRRHVSYFGDEEQ